MDEGEQVSEDQAAAAPYSPLMIASSFIHCSFVVRPLPPKSPGGPPRYQLAIAAKDGVRPWKPLLPRPPVFEHGSAFRECASRSPAACCAGDV
jgi:hypothetical protein